MRSFRLHLFVIFRSETPGRLAPAGWDFRVGFFAWDFSFKIVRFENFHWKWSLGIFRGNFHLIAFVWDPSFRNFRFAAFALKVSFWNFRLGAFA